MLTNVSVRSLLKNYMNKQPLALIVGNKKHAEFRIPARYCPEYEYYKNHEENQIKSRENERTKFIRWMFRFEWLPNQEFTPWWESSTENHAIFTELISISLSVDFIWEDAPENLDYVKSFLSPGLLDTNQRIQIPFSILPPQPQSDLNGLIDQSFDSQHWKGYHCLRCGRISCRNNWKEWICANCGIIHLASHKILLPHSLRDPDLPLLIGPAADYDICVKDGSQITVSRNVTSDGAIICRYDFPEGGHVIHKLGNLSLNALPNKLFNGFQNKNIHFKRNVVKSARGN
ncbi:9061_t:CDS:2 [Diversispora eburnea]|uniref:9061_t:CDS:1 n=1 Tax=Diversispora eburnea TaxID=1213867 RepID=A0A9N9BWP0_9GLOM|nr:9061_t:CDS:2 [Diversispora eburnea]